MIFACFMRLSRDLPCPDVLTWAACSGSWKAAALSATFQIYETDSRCLRQLQQQHAQGPPHGIWYLQTGICML